MDKVKQVLFESIDKALSNVDFVNKEQFYSILWQDCGVQPQDVSERYDKFYQLLRDLYGVNHFKIEREIIKVLHESSEEGRYKEINEISAFALMVESYF